MAVYVDDMHAPVGSHLMCHMIADSEDELHAMAALIGIERRRHQNPETMRVYSSHYDIIVSEKDRAIAAGAVSITWLQCSAMAGLRRSGHAMGDPQTALARYRIHMRAVMARNAG
jgi:hypothetical protein